MADLRDFAVKITRITDLQLAGADLLNEVCFVTKPNGGQREIIEITNPATLSSYTDSVVPQSFFDGGLQRIYLLLDDVGDLQVDDLLDDNELAKFYTMVVDPTDETGFDLATFQGRDFGDFEGVTGYSFDEEVIDPAYETLALTENINIFQDFNDGKVQAHAFGRFLSSFEFTGQQYAPTIDGALGTDSLGVANSIFNKRISFVFIDTVSPGVGPRLGFFGGGGDNGITVPYHKKELEILLQNTGTSFVQNSEPPFNQVVIDNLNGQYDKILNDFVIANKIIDYTLDIRSIDQQDTSTFTLKGIEIATEDAQPLWRQEITIRNI